MVKSAPFMLVLLLWCGPSLAQQDAGAPPVAETQAPLPPDSGAPPDTTPALSAPAPALPDAPAMPLPVDTDLVTLIVKAHPVVQAVMGLLAVSVFAVLTIFLFKMVEFSLAFRNLGRSARLMASAPDELPAPGTCALADTARAASGELADLPARLSTDLRTSARERLDLKLSRIEAAAVRRLRSGTGLLASIGAVAPFVGLFGTVFGIMNSFLAIADSQTTNLAVVAPGIAEALLATGIGLVAAIPAVLLYNHLMRRIAAFRHHLADGTALVLHRFSLALDARMGPTGMDG